MEITLSPELERFVRELVESGRFPDESAVVHAAISAIQNDDFEIPDIPGGIPWTQETLRAAVQIGIDQADRGEFVESDADDIMRRVDQRLERERKQLGQKAG